MAVLSELDSFREDRPGERAVGISDGLGAVIDSWTPVRFVAGDGQVDEVIYGVRAW